MVIPNLPPDDLPPQQLEIGDQILLRQLDLSLTQMFLRQCDSVCQQLLAQCHWAITTTANVAMLVIVCPNKKTNWLVLNQVTILANSMAQISQDAKLRIYPTPQRLDYFEIRVDELPIYQEGS
jgi:UDP-N-acetyl-D-mannosaminuronic acid transferase (WecB/TagA/CpsF family)